MRLCFIYLKNTPKRARIKIRGAASVGIECYIKMKNLNKRLYQGASTQHCLWLTGSSTSGAHRRLPAGRRVDCTAAGACLRQAVAL